MKIHITIIILLIFLTFITLRSCFHKQGYINVTQDSAVYWKDKYNTEHISKMAGNIQEPSAFLNDIKNQTKQKDVQEVTAIGATASGFLHPTVDTVYLSDSTTAYKLRFHDQWLDLTIGPYAGYGWDGKAFTPSVGISLQYSFIKF